MKMDGTFAQALHTVFGACRVEQHQGPALFVEALVDLVPELNRKQLRDVRGFVVVALGGNHHQLACARFGAGQRVGAEVRRNDQCKLQRALAHQFARKIC